MTILRSIREVERDIQKTFPNAQVRMWEDLSSYTFRMKVETEESIRNYIFNMLSEEWTLTSTQWLKYDNHEAFSKHKKVMQERRDRKCSRRNL